MMSNDLTGNFQNIESDTQLVDSVCKGIEQGRIKAIMEEMSQLPNCMGDKFRVSQHAQFSPYGARPGEHGWHYPSLELRLEYTSVPNEVFWEDEKSEVKRSNSTSFFFKGITNDDNVTRENRFVGVETSQIRHDKVGPAWSGYPYSHVFERHDLDDNEITVAEAIHAFVKDVAPNRLDEVDQIIAKHYGAAFNADLIDYRDEIVEQFDGKSAHGGQCSEAPPTQNLDTLS